MGDDSSLLQKVYVKTDLLPFVETEFPAFTQEYGNMLNILSPYVGGSFKKVKKTKKSKSKKKTKSKKIKKKKKTKSKKK